MILSIERRRLGWSRAELARRAERNAATVGLIESGRFDPYPSQLKKLARALGWPVSEALELLDEERAEQAKPGLRPRGNPASGEANPA